MIPPKQPIFVSLHPPQEENRKSDSQEGIKYDDGKLRFDLMPARSLQQIAEVFSYGAQKYCDRNWEKGMDWGRLFAATQRHLWAFWSGEDNDPESGIPHLAHAGFGILALLEFAKTHPELDDRVKNL